METKAKTGETLSRGSVTLRGFLNVFTSGVLFLSTNTVWAGMVGVRGAMFTALAGVVAQAWRNFLDQSSSRREKEVTDEPPLDEAATPPDAFSPDVPVNKPLSNLSKTVFKQP